MIVINADTFEQDYISRAAFDEVAADRDALRAEVERLRAALEWYADPAHYERGIPGHYGPSRRLAGVCAWIHDHGQRARAALANNNEAHSQHEGGE